jgi:hypothetical protein
MEVTPDADADRETDDVLKSADDAAETAALEAAEPRPRSPPTTRP